MGPLILAPGNWTKLLRKCAKGWKKAIHLIFEILPPCHSKKVCLLMTSIRPSWTAVREKGFASFRCRRTPRNQDPIRQGCRRRIACLLSLQKQEQIQTYQKAICRSKYGDFMLSIKEQIRLLLWTLFTLRLLRFRHAGFNSAWCNSTWFSQFECC